MIIALVKVPPIPLHVERTPLANRTLDKVIIDQLETLNDPRRVGFEPTITLTWDTPDLQRRLPPWANKWLLQPYLTFARKVVRVEADVVMLNHLIIYFTTLVPSALYLYYHFTWLHGVLHWIMQSYFVGTYTLMMHQHIHMGGILSKPFWLFDSVFPYITNPLMGHTWNSYYYHHVKHHHVEGNGPSDLSSTVRYQRDNLSDFLCYVGRFFFFIWFELPLYFIRKGHLLQGLKAGFWELGNYYAIYALYTYASARATVFVFILPVTLLRVGLMVGNWGQHALVDEIDPNSDFRSSVTLIDVPVSIQPSRAFFGSYANKHRVTVSASMTATTPPTTSTPAATGATTPSRS